MMPDAPLVDAHHHLWDPARRAYDWMGPELEAIRRRFDLDDLRAVTAPAGVERTVLVQAVGTLEETRELLATAADSDGLVAGVVGWVDLTGGAAEEIAALRAGPGGEKLVGIRHPAQDEPDPEWLLRRDVKRGLAAVAEAGLVYDLLVRPLQMAAAVSVAAELADVRFVLDHAGKPPIAEGDLERWRRQSAAIAAAPNVVCKLSGLVTEADWERWRPADVEPVVEHLLATFGPRRLMFGSDWPVCTLAASYEDVLGLAAGCLERLGAEEREAVMSGVAKEVYGLDG
jgi:L-fuconolactonase